jgi:hypothetical protein
MVEPEVVLQTWTLADRGSRSRSIWARLGSAGTLALR